MALAGQARQWVMMVPTLLQGQLVQVARVVEEPQRIPRRLRVGQAEKVGMTLAYMEQLAAAAAVVRAAPMVEIL